jgi:hypothetical protein
MGQSTKQEALYRQAVAAYENLCGWEGPVETSQALSSVGRKYVHLRNESGDYVAKYDHKEGVIVEVWLTQAAQEKATVWVRQPWNNRHLAKYRLADLRIIHWENSSAGAQATVPQSYLYAHVWCDQMLGIPLTKHATLVNWVERLGGSGLED